MIQRRAALTLGVVFGVLLVACVPASTMAAESRSSKVCTFDVEALPEVSGITQSIQHRGILWVHNDSPDTVTNGEPMDPKIFAIDASTCKLVATITLADVPGRDIEAIASGRDGAGKPVLWVADFGDNQESWDWVRLYQLPEPAELTDQRVPVRAWRFAYPDGPHDAETLLVNPRKPQIWVITKGLAAGTLYSMPRLPPLELGEVWRDALVVKPVGDVEGLISDGAVSYDATRYVTRDYLTATVYEGLPPGKKIATVELPTQPQGEAITWSRDGRSLLAAGERDGTLWSISLPREAWSKAAQVADAALPADDPGTAQTEGDDSPLSVSTLLGLTLVGLIIAVSLVGFRRSRQTHRRFR